MDKRILSIFCAALLLALSGLPLRAQSVFAGRSSLSVQAGPSWYTGRFLGLTHAGADYRGDLRRGVAWSVDYWWRGARGDGHRVRVQPGLLYQGSTYSGSWQNGSDRLHLHYIAPQFGLFGGRGRWLWQASVGAGYQFFKNHSRVYGRDRRVSMNKLAANLSAGGEYAFTHHWAVALRLHWLLSTSDRYNVSYHDGENATIRDTMVKHGARAAEITAPEKEGFEFVAWTLNGEPYDFSLPVTSDIVLVAQYEPLPPTVTVDKEIPEDAVMSGTIPDDVRDGDEIVLPDVSKPGESFVGWDTDGDGTADSQPGDSVEYIDGQTSLTPVFEDIEDDKQHQITIEGAPEIPFDNWYVEEDRPIVLPDIPREDEVLVGYDTDSDGIADVMPGQEYAPTGDVTLTPIFEEKPQHSVSSDIEEDAATSEPVPDTVYEGSEVVLPDASRPGQVLEGWDTDGDGTADKQPGETVVADDDVTLKPVWRPLEDDEVQHEVTVDAGDGESPFDSWYPVDGQPVTLPEPSIDGDREFQGWVDQDGNRYQAGDVVYPSEDMTLTAQWSDAPEEGTEWWVYAAIVIAVILVIVAVVLILHYRVGVI